MGNGVAHRHRQVAISSTSSSVWLLEIKHAREVVALACPCCGQASYTMTTPWPPAPVAGPPTPAGHQSSGSPGSETSTWMRALWARPTSAIDTRLAAAETAAAARPLATGPSGKAMARKSSAAPMRFSQRSSRGVFARRALTLSMISRAKSARLTMAASYSSTSSR
eukprot:4891818-Prymnesium_polylepis.1